MKFEDCKVGMACDYLESSGRTDRMTITRIDSAWKVWGTFVSEGGMELFCSAESLTPVLETPSLPAQFKINVQKYADDNGITLEQAHKEIQPWLLEQDYKWFNEGVHYTASKYVYGENKRLGHAIGSFEQTFVNNEATEIFLQREATVKLSLLPPVAAPEPLVELNGRKYRKEDLEAALSKLVAVEE